MAAALRPGPRRDDRPAPRTARCPAATSDATRALLQLTSEAEPRAATRRAAAAPRAPTAPPDPRGEPATLESRAACAALMLMVVATVARPRSSPQRWQQWPPAIDPRTTCSEQIDGLRNFLDEHSR